MEKGKTHMSCRVSTKIPMVETRSLYLSCNTTYMSIYFRFYMNKMNHVEASGRNEEGSFFLVFDT